MGFAINYRSTRTVDANEAKTIRNAAEKLTDGKTWLSSGPIYFHACTGMVVCDEEDCAGRSGHARLEENLYRGKDRWHQELLCRDES